MNLVPVHQPVGSRLCGQACIATLFGISLDLSVAIINKLGATRTRDLVRAIRLLDGECEDRLTRTLAKDRTKSIPSQGIYLVKMKSTVDKKMSHWVLFHDGCLIDPEARKDNPCLHWETAKYTSYLRIKLPVRK